MTIIAAPTGEGKTTTLYSIIDHLNKPGLAQSNFMEVFLCLKIRKRK